MNSLADESRAKPTVFIVDDDASVRQAMESLLRSAGLEAESFSSAQGFLQSEPTGRAGCVILDVCLPKVSGLQLQAQMAKREIDLPIIFVTAHGDVRMCVEAMKAGAVDFLLKPFRERELLAAVDHAIRHNSEVHHARQERHALLTRFATLSHREREVMSLAVAGYLNKQIAARLGAAEITIKIHRRRVMDKMRAKSFADLVRAAEKLGLTQSGGA
ncbi:MAG TPA: response regulator [Opitutaceae bacterium]|nr:response regulator [Opitutaceae bacterium]